MGPQVVLELEPKTCEIDPAAKVIACTPARLVLRKVPGECALKHLTPASWSGKECKVTITVRLLTILRFILDSYRMILYKIHARIRIPLNWVL